MARILLSDYMPDPSELSPEDVIDARQRLTTYLAKFWPELDTRPNSVFGDIHLTPMAVLMASLEVAQEKRDSDLDLANAAKGQIFSEDLVLSFLRNFGARNRTAVPSRGVIKLTFQENKSYVIDPDTDFFFGQDYFKINPDEGSPVIVYPVDSTSGKRVLFREDNSKFVVMLPVTGNPGVTVTDGALGSCGTTLDGLLSVSAAGDFDMGLPAASIQELAANLPANYPAASLTSRAGVVAYISYWFPQVVGVSAILSGDTEMLRDVANPLGVAEGAVDIYLRSRRAYAKGELVLPLAFNADKQSWVGKLDLPTVPAFFDLAAGVFQINGFLNSRGENLIYSKSNLQNVDNLGVAFSRHETLGISIKDTSPSGFEPGYVGSVTQTAGQGAILEVAGEYWGSVFKSRHERAVSLRFDSVTTVGGEAMAVVAASDQLSGESFDLLFQAESPGSTTGIIVKNEAYREVFNGLDIFIRADAVFDPESMLGFSYTFSFKAKTSSFSVNYIYDPLLLQADSLISDLNNKPVGVSVLTKSFIPCYLDQFVVTYRVQFGDKVDLVTARQQISDYLNGVTWPGVYEESRITDIMFSNGASGVQTVLKHGLIYPSLASIFVQADGTEQGIPAIETTTLIPTINDYGVSTRNISYIIDPATIRFNSIIA